MRLGVTTIIYKICEAAQWRQAALVGSYGGSEADARDGFIHFSTGTQVRETARKHFAGGEEKPHKTSAERNLVHGDTGMSFLGHGAPLVVHHPTSLPVKQGSHLLAMYEVTPYGHAAHVNLPPLFRYSIHFPCLI